MIMAKQVQLNGVSKFLSSKSFLFSIDDTIKKSSRVKQKIVLGIPEPLVFKIIEKLKIFESDKGFLEHEITLMSTAKILNTNSTYLSKVINKTRNKNFANYINDLRIEYTINQLKLNPKYRRYSISAIADEVGFNNTKSFSRAFYKKTGKQTSLFIKELE